MRPINVKNMNIRALTIALALLGLSAPPAFAATPTAPPPTGPGSTVLVSNAPAKPPCWDSIGAWDGAVVLSQTGLGAFDSAAADDFTLMKRCRVRGLTVAGVHFAGVGPVDSEDVTIYRKGKRHPKRIVFQATIAGVDDAGTLRIPIEPPLALRKGHYWLSVRANEDFAEGGQFGWKILAPGARIGSPAVWANPGDGLGTGCTTWRPLAHCGWPAGERDLQFRVDQTFGAR